ncbi:dTMP kinase [Micromonospora sp. C95]|uniref:dTMP kinase n=1 Tax=Micromonospora sp. C95 TaxID=2824882 RepID=UPI001B377715|nr:dTMP kinase [Micromonospora sp. C95]MBQ1026034.1 dTMP kinase [Micromonospora sp. C95]
MGLPKFVSFAGIDGSGKSTQVAAVAAALAGRGIEVVTSKTSLSATYSIFHLAEEMFGDPHSYHPAIPPTLREFVIACDVVQHSRLNIEPRLAAGQTVIWDRGPLCYEAYARAYGVDPLWIMRMLRLVRPPEVTFLLDVDPALAWKRIVTRTEKPAQTNEHVRFLRTFRDEYLRLAQQCPAVVVLDAERPAEELTADILERLVPCSVSER